jgi:hypothetical protein
MARKRRHTNTKGLRQIRRGVPAKQMRRLSRRLGVPYGAESEQDAHHAPASNEDYTQMHSPLSCVVLIIRHYQNRDINRKWYALLD